MLALGALFVLLSFLMAFPHPLRLTRATAGDYGDGYFTQWLLRWDFHALRHAPSHLYDANIFWPHKGTLAYSETMLPAALVVGPLSLVVGWTTAFNVVYLATWVASLASMYVLAMWFTNRPGPSVVAAVVFTFSGLRLSHYGHFQLGWAFLIPLGFWFLFRFLVERRYWQACALGLSFVAVTLMVSYYGLIFAVALVVVVAGWLIASRFRPGLRFFTGLALAAAIVAALLAVPVWRYQRLQTDPVFRRQYTPAYASHPGDFLAPPIGSRLWRVLDDAAERSHRTGENRLFPGVAAIVLAATGVIAAARRFEPPDRQAVDRDLLRRRALILLVVAGGVALVLSLGNYQYVGSHRIALPEQFFYDHVPGFHNARAVSRFAIIALVPFAVLAARGVVRLTAGRSGWISLVATAALVAVVLGESSTGIATAQRVDRSSATAVNNRLRGLPPGPVVELPVADIADPRAPSVEAPRMVLSAIDWLPRVNGYSGFFPDGYGNDAFQLDSLADGSPATADATATIRRLRIRYIVVRTVPLTSQIPKLEVPGVGFYDPATASRVVAALPPDLVKGSQRVGDAILIELRN